MNKQLLGYDIEVDEDDDFDITELEEEDNDYDIDFENYFGGVRHHFFDKRYCSNYFSSENAKRRGGRK